MQDLGDEAGGGGGHEDGEDRRRRQLGRELLGDGAEREEHGGVGGEGGDAGFGGAGDGEERVSACSKERAPDWRWESALTVLVIGRGCLDAFPSGLARRPRRPREQERLQSA